MSFYWNYGRCILRILTVILSSSVAIKQHNWDASENNPESHKKTELVGFLHFFYLEEGHICDNYKIATVQQKENDWTDLKSWIKWAYIISPVETWIGNLLNVQIDVWNQQDYPDSKAKNNLRHVKSSLININDFILNKGISSINGKSLTEEIEWTTTSQKKRIIPRKVDWESE
jgi:hypothetical protein